MDGTALGWLAFGLVAGSIALWARGIRRVRLPRNRAGFVAAWLGGLVLGIAAFVQGVSWLGGLPAGLAVAVAGFGLFTVAISAQAVAPNAIRVGARLPDLTAPDEDGKLFSLASLAGAPVLLKFFRGHW